MVEHILDTADRTLSTFVESRTYTLLLPFSPGITALERDRFEQFLINNEYGIFAQNPETILGCFDAQESAQLLCKSRVKLSACTPCVSPFWHVFRGQFGFGV